MYTQVLDWPRTTKRAVVILLDVVLCLVSMWLAFSLRLETFHIPQGTQWWAYLLAPLIAIPIFIRLGLYRAIFRYTGLDALVAISQAIALYAVILTCLLLLQPLPVIPRTLGILQPIIFLLLVSTSRALARFWLAGVHGLLRPANQGRLLIFGAGVVGVQTASAMAMTRQFNLLGFVDENTSKIGRTINGVPVFSPDQVAAVVSKPADEVLLV